MIIPEMSETWNITHNCGSYALNSNIWITPFDEDIDDRIEFIWDMLNSGLGLEETRDLILNLDCAYIRDNFNLKEISFKNFMALAPETEVIAYRIFLKVNIPKDEEGEIDICDIDYDFHFRVRKEGRWVEKCGEEPIGFVVDSENEEWDVFPLTYSSQIRYFIKKY